MIETILQRFQDGDYNTENGAKLFVLDMAEAEAEVDSLKTEIEHLEQPTLI